MKVNYLAAALYLAPALAAPVFQKSTVLVAGASAKTVVIRPGHQAIVEENKQFAFDGTSLSPSKAEQTPSSAALDADRPLTTLELKALSEAAARSAQEAASAHQKGPGGGNKIKISVGTLVVPGGAGARPSSGSSVIAQFFDPKAARPFLVSGYYIPAQRPDVWAAGMIISFVLVVVGLELWGLMRQSLRSAWRREGSIKLDDHAVGLEEGGDDSDDEDDMTPFGGYRHRAEADMPGLPEKPDEKAGWI